MPVHDMTKTAHKVTGQTRDGQQSRLSPGLAIHPDSSSSPFASASAGFSLAISFVVILPRLSELYPLTFDLHRQLAKEHGGPRW